MKKKVHLNLFIQGRGHHEAGWRHPGAAGSPLTDIDELVAQAELAELGTFDSIFLSDSLVLGEDAEFVATGGLEPVTALAALARATTNIGLIATASTSYSDPYNLARQFASLDHISHGRVGWNIVTSWAHNAGSQFGREQVDLERRYEQADEFVQVTNALWDSWGDGAVIIDAPSGRYLDRSRISKVDHIGEFYRVAGPLNIPRSPQGRPVLVQAGSSAPGRQFAGKYAEAVFTAHLNKSSAIEFFADVKGIASHYGRGTGDLLVLPGLNAAIAETDAAAKSLMEELNGLTSIDIGLRRLSRRFGGYSFSHLPLDQPLSVDDFPDPTTIQGAQSRTQSIVDLVAQERPTMRQILARLAGARGHYSVSGCPERIADIIIDWVESGAADGFNVMPPVLPAQLHVFVDTVVPLLRRRGYFREAYEGSTLRSHFSLARPRNKFFS